MCQILKLDVSQIASVNTSIICFQAKSNTSVYHQNACFVLKRSAYAVPRTTEKWLWKLLLQPLLSDYSFHCLAGTSSISTSGSGLANPAVQHSSALKPSYVAELISCYMDAEDAKPEP